MAGKQYDAPNQQVVRPDGSGPGDEGTGGSTPQPASKAKKADGEDKGDTTSARSKSSGR